MTTKITEKNISNLANFAVDWQSVVTADGSTNTTAVAGKGYFIDTTSAAHTIVLPASPSFGDTIIINDYASTFATNNVTINPNGNKIEAETTNGILSTNDQTHTLVYTDSTQGWKIINQDTVSPIQPSFVAATGGTVTTSTDYKIHTFTGDGCFVVTNQGNPAGSTSVDYLVVAGGGGAGTNHGAGGGAGGYRESHSTPVSGCYTASPLATPTGITLTATTYPITVGAGGGAPPVGSAQGGSGSNSVFSTITSTGGGGGGSGGGSNPVPSGVGLPGGSGGGAGGFGPGTKSGGTGNTPPVSPPQGQSGGSTTSPGSGYTSAGGGGATATGASPSSAFGTGGSDGSGGAGAGTNINPATGETSGGTQYYAGGGGGGLYNPGLPTTTINPGGIGGGGDASQNGATPIPAAQHNGTANTGGGAGGGGNSVGGYGGGKGIVIIRYKFQN